MRLIILSLGLLSSVNVLANGAAREYLVQDLTLYASQYQITSFEVGDYLGVMNKKYSFDLRYTKGFCKADMCETYQCRTIIGLDSDAIADFEPELDSNKCDKL